MFTLVAGMFAALLATVSADAPLSGGYNYQPAGGYPSGGGGYPSGGGDYIPVAPGPSTYEGQYVDYQLLEKIKQVLLKDESQSSSSGGYPSSSYGAPSSSYGVPSSSYGVPSGWQSKVVAIDLEGVKPAIQVAEYEQGHSPSSHYGAPHGGGYPSRPSSSYGVPSY